MATKMRCSFEQCGSPLEHVLLNRLLNVPGGSVATQYECGPYRLDFFLDGIGVEVDGKDFHEAAKDWRRDRWILDHCDVAAIVRFSGAAVKFFLESCQGVLSVSFPGVFSCFAGKPNAFDAATCQKYYDALRENDEWWAINELYNGEGYGIADVDGTPTMCVGSPLAFVEQIDAEAMSELDAEYHTLATVKIPVTIQRK